MNREEIKARLQAIQEYQWQCREIDNAHRELMDFHQRFIGNSLGEIATDVGNMTLDCIDTQKNDAPQHVLDNYELILDDDFNTGALDCSTWTTSFRWGPDHNINNEEQWYIDTCQNGIYGGLSPNPTTPSPFSFSGSDLIITASPNTDQSLVFNNLGTQSGQVANYTSGIITTQQNIWFTEGYAEVCIKPPCNAQGSWPAAWLFQRDYLFGASHYNPEIDFLEMPQGNGLTSQCVQQNYHYFSGTPGTPGETRWDLGPGGYTASSPPSAAPTFGAGQYTDCDGNLAFSMPSYCLPNGEDFCDNYHTFGVDYRSDGIDFYVDGIITHCLTNLPIPQQPLFLIINLAVGGAYPGAANPADYPASLAVDYARMYKKS